MSALEKPLVYLILGTTGAGRRQVLLDLIEDGLSEAERAAVMLADVEPADETDARLPLLTRWSWNEDGAISGTLPPGATHVFFLANGRRSPVDQAEVFKPWVEAQGGQVARVICIIDARMAQRNPPLLAWFEACVHFSDVVLLNKREGLENKWVSDFLGHFKDQYYPCHFERVKNGRVHNPALILEPQARRMTHVFDDEQDWIFTDSEGEIIDEQEETKNGEDEIEAKPEEDPYFERRFGGRRVKEIPDISKFQ